MVETLVLIFVLIPCLILMFFVAKKEQECIKERNEKFIGVLIEIHNELYNIEMTLESINQSILFVKGREF